MKIKVIGKTKLLAPTMEGGFEFAPGYVFTCDSACTDYDWLVCFDDLPVPEALLCPRERTILATWEPVSIKVYSRAFTLQFGHYLTNRPAAAERHPHRHLGRGYFPWCVGRSYQEVAAKTDYPKSETVSAVCSAKQMRHTAHHSRFATLAHLQRAIPGMKWYGVGFNRLKGKYNALDGFRYHVAIENHIAPDHWSEKLPDPILCECLPFYAGDPDLGRILPPESFIRIPYDDPPEAERIIKAAIAADEWTKRLPAIREARRLLLTKYNFWAQVIEVIKASEGQSVTPADPSRPVRLYGHRAYRLRHPLSLLSDLWGRMKLTFSCYKGGENG